LTRGHGAADDLLRPRFCAGMTWQQILGVTQVDAAEVKMLGSSMAMTG